ncbi:MAG: Gfo/Idh/MocA family oxidoreductase [Alphaproteobacteria bacterium]|nr:Gfo/Idh/MocA family oxidoreductase [Alphaproteobacteria bacterium]
MIDAAVIGLGRWGKSLIAAVQGKSDKLRFVHGVSKEPDTVCDFAAQNGFRLSTDLSDVLSDPQVQAVFLATPHSLHVSQVKAVAAKGLPVWCEKPLSLTRAGAQRAVDACRKAGVVLGSGNNKRCFASMRELKRIVDEGALGDILHIEGHFSNEHSTRVVGGGWRDDPSESPGGGLTGAGLHVLDALVNLGGPIKSVDAKLFERKPPPDPRDVLAVLVEFATGATGMLATVRAAPAFWRIHVFGTEGMAEARDEDTLILGRIGDTPKVHTYEHVDSLKVLAEAFADAVAGRAPFPVATSQMLDMIAAFEAIVASLQTRAPVRIDG